MEEKAIQNLLIDILCSELHDTEMSSETKSKLSDDTLLSLYKLADLHDLAHILSSALNRAEIAVPSELSAKLQKKEQLSVLRCELIKYELEQLCLTLGEASIPHIPLKGSVIRPFYPIESMRTSCDIDILVKPSDLNRAAQAVVERLNYTKDAKGDHDIAFNTPSGIHFELHFSLIEDDGALDTLLSRVWEYAHPEQNHRYAFSDSFYLFYHIAHMAKHFKNGGCGIRPFMDLWVIENRMNISRNAADELLASVGLEKFSNAALSLADAWFSGKNHTELSLEMQEFLMNAGTYGSLENNVIAKKAQKSENTFVYILRRLFLPYKQMCLIYPVLKKAPFLLPFMWIVRIFQRLFSGSGKKAVREVQISKAASSEEVTAVRQLYDNLGL